MFTFNTSSSSAGGILGTSAPPPPPVFGSSNNNSSNAAPPPVFGGVLSNSQGMATPLSATPVFGGSSGSSGPNNTHNTSGSHGGGFSFAAHSAQGILSQSSGGPAPRGTNSNNTSGSSSNMAPAVPPNYAAALPASSTPVFGGPVSSSSASGLINNNSSSSSGAPSSVPVAPRSLAPPTPVGHFAGTARGAERGGAILGQPQPPQRQQQQHAPPPFRHNGAPVLSTGQSSPQPPPFGVSVGPNTAGGAPFQQQQHQQQHPQHRKFGAQVPQPVTTTPPRSAPAPSAASAPVGAGVSASVLGSDSRGLTSAPPPLPPPSSSGHHPVFGASPFAQQNAVARAAPPAAAGLPPPPSLSSPSSPPPPALGGSAGVLPSAGPGVGGAPAAGGAASNSFSNASSSFNSPFGWAPTAPPQPQKSDASPAAPAQSRPPAATIGASAAEQHSSGGSGSSAFGSAAPLKSVFGAASPSAPAAPSSSFPGTTAAAASTTTSAFGAAPPGAPRPPPSAAPSVFSGLGAAPTAAAAAAKTSVFGSDAANRPGGEGKAPASTAAAAAAAAPPSTSIFAALAEATSAAAPPPAAPVKSAFSGAFNATASAAPPPPPPSSAFAASPSPALPLHSGGGVGCRDVADSDAGHGDRGGGRRRGRSPAAQSAAASPHPRSETAPSFSIPAPRHAQQHQNHHHQQQQQQQRAPTTVSRAEKMPLPSLPADEKQWSLAARICKSFLLQLASPGALGGGGGGVREIGAADALEQAFFGAAVREGVSGNFATTAGEMLAVWQQQVRPAVTGGNGSNKSSNSSGGALPFPGEVWVAAFALGTYINVIVATLTSASRPALASTRADLAAYKAGLCDNPAQAFTDACHYANELSELLQTLVQRGGEAEAPPYSVIPVVLRRVRTVFDEANARGVATVQSNLSAVTLKLFAVLNRRVKTTAAVLPGSGLGGGVPVDKSGAWLLLSDTKEKESLLHSFAYLVCEMIAVDAPMNEDVDHFVAAFHTCLPSALAERCMLYYRRACALLRQPLRMQQVGVAAELLAKALAVYPPGAPPHNRRVVEVKLLTAELALGKLPPDQDRLALDVPQLIDVVNALRTSRLDLLDVALRMHGPYFVQSGVHNILMMARQRIALLMVVKFYVTHGCENQLRVMDMVRYHNLPYSAAEAGMVWLLPLLVEMCLNGVLDHEYLVLSTKNPFNEYPRAMLLAAAGLPAA